MLTLREAVTLAVVGIVVLSAAIVGAVLISSSDSSPGSRSPSTTTSDKPHNTTTSTVPASDGGGEAVDIVRFYGSPFGSQNLTVGIQKRSEESRDFRPLVSKSIQYWNQNGSGYGEYNATYQLRPNADEPDIVVRFVQEIEACGVENTTQTIGCAALLSPSSRVEHPEVVQIETGLSNETTINTIKHELGHTRGIEHKESPMPLMAAVNTHVTTEPRPNASERPDPWGGRETLSVFLTGSAAGTDAREQLQHALSYYERGAGGWLPAANDRYEFQIVADRTDADIVVRVSESSTHYTSGGVQRPLDGGSVVVLTGTDPDGDGAFEQYETMTITTADVEGRRLAWHIGSSLASAYGDTPSERPEAFSEDADRTARFW